MKFQPTGCIPFMDSVNTRRKLLHVFGKYTFRLCQIAVPFTVLLLVLKPTDVVLIGRVFTVNYSKLADGHLLEERWDFTKLSQNKAFIQNVTQDGRAMVFSAYVDDSRNVPKVRAIGMKEIQFNVNISCIVWYRKGNTTGSININGYIDPHTETFDRSWWAVDYTCPLGDNPTDPYAVSIISGDDGVPLNLIRIKYTADDPLVSYTVCVHNALNFRYDVSHMLVEFVEVQRLLGAERIVIYNYTSHPNNDVVLKMYADDGIVTLVPWDLPLYVDMIFVGQVGVMQDCLHRNLYSTKYLVHLDLDEYIVPRRDDVMTVPQMLSQLPQHCAYIALCNAFLVAEGVAETEFRNKAMAKQFHLDTLLVQQRQSYIWKPKDRSKIIIRPTCVEKPGVHVVSEFSSKKIQSETVLEPEDGLLHHYRHGKPKFVKRGDRLEDQTMLKYADALVDNVSKAWRKINAIKGGKNNRSL